MNLVWKNNEDCCGRLYCTRCIDLTLNVLLSSKLEIPATRAERIFFTFVLPSLFLARRAQLQSAALGGSPDKIRLADAGATVRCNRWGTVARDLKVRIHLEEKNTRVTI